MQSYVFYVHARTTSQDAQNQTEKLLQSTVTLCNNQLKSETLCGNAPRTVTAGLGAAQALCWVVVPYGRVKARTAAERPQRLMATESPRDEVLLGELLALLCLCCKNTRQTEKEIDGARLNLMDFIRALGLVSKANAGRSAGMVLYRYRGSFWKTPGQTLVSVMLLSGGTEGLPDVTFYPPAGTMVLKPRLLAVLTTTSCSSRAKPGIVNLVVEHPAGRCCSSQGPVNNQLLQRRESGKVDELSFLSRTPPGSELHCNEGSKLR
ncbi:hypothetical protein Anapl_10675 [Anas platyrhynchos]|uniref:Uncharacterized protein n=1 Tax=Anas platyrhynchos TaxID=8839 RepID=R0L839_ANAPL|nr:hypothetical protein Anapl_10675 [Anas platyrhynchos]